MLQLTSGVRWMKKDSQNDFLNETLPTNTEKTKLKTAYELLCAPIKLPVFFNQKMSLKKLKTLRKC